MKIKQKVFRVAAENVVFSSVFFRQRSTSSVEEVRFCLQKVSFKFEFLFAHKRDAEARSLFTFSTEKLQKPNDLLRFKNAFARQLLPNERWRESRVDLMNI